MKRLLDKEFYDGLDDKIKEILTFKEFMFLERRNFFDCEYYEYLINRIAEITNFEGNTIEKILNFIQVLDLDYEKIGSIIKDCDFIKDIKDKNE